VAENSGGGVLGFHGLSARGDDDYGLGFLRPGWRRLLTVNSCIEFHLDLQADKSPVVVKGPFFPRVVNPRYRIRGTNV
jgi:hypothetical protein